jgi:hypothetical protein
MITNESERHIRRREGFVVHARASKLNSLVRCELKSTIVIQADSGATTTTLVACLKTKWTYQSTTQAKMEWCSVISLTKNMTASVSNP